MRKRNSEILSWWVEIEKGDIYHTWKEQKRNGTILRQFVSILSWAWPQVVPWWLSSELTKLHMYSISFEIIWKQYKKCWLNLPRCFIKSDSLPTRCYKMMCIQAIVFLEPQEVWGEIIYLLIRKTSLAMPTQSNSWKNGHFSDSCNPLLENKQKKEGNKCGEEEKESSKIGNINFFSVFGKLDVFVSSYSSSSL